MLCIQDPVCFVRRQLYIFLIDISLSMAGAGICGVNWLVAELIDVLKEHDLSPTPEIYVQFIAFSDIAERMYPEPIAVRDLTFEPLELGSASRNISDGLRMATEEVKALEESSRRIARPTIILFSDAQLHLDWEPALPELLVSGAGKHSRRIACFAGDDANPDRQLLEPFISTDQRGVYCLSEGSDLLYHQVW